MEVIMKKPLIFYTFLITTLLLTACDKKTPPLPKPPIEVSVMKIIAQDTPIDFEYVGQTLSPNEVELRARVAGFLDNSFITMVNLSLLGKLCFRWTQNHLKLNY